MLKYVILLRPRQWVKNLILFAGLIFSHHLDNLNSLLTTIAAFSLFCLLSSSVYIFNDLHDLENDRQHPNKRFRPLPAGQIKPKTAWFIFVLLALLSLTLSFLLAPTFGLIALSYLVMFIAYTLYLKHVVIIDVLIIALGFVLRAAAGAAVLRVEISPWLLVCTILLALFLALSKRRHELILLEENAESHRKILEEYSAYFLDQMISVVTASTVMSYTLYTLSERTIRELKTTNLPLTIPFVLYGIFRYLYLIHLKSEGGRPEQLLFTDRPLLIDIILWGLSVSFILYLR